MEDSREFSDHCIFPSLVCSRNIDAGVGIVTLPIAENIGNVSVDDISSTARLIEVAWSITLSKYTDSQTVSFGILRNAGTKQSLEQWQATIDDGAPINSATKLRKVRGWLPDDDSHCNIFNTCIYFAGTEHQVAESKSCESVCNPMVRTLENGSLGFQVQPAN